MFTGFFRTASLAVFYLAIPLGSGLGYMIAPKVTAMSGDWRWSLCVTPAIVSFIVQSHLFDCLAKIILLLIGFFVHFSFSCVCQRA
jgi:hypothetical protein